MSKRFAAAALAALIGAGLTAPAFAADAVTPTAKPAAEQAAPKAKHEAQKAEGKAKHEGQTAAKPKHDGAKAKDAVKKTDKTL